MAATNQLESLILEKSRHVLAPERRDDWLALRESLNDQALTRVPVEGYLVNMRAVYLQLLGGALARSRGGFEAMIRDPVEGMRLNQMVEAPLAGHVDEAKIEAVSTEYNRAFGSSPTRGGEAMVEVFSRLVVDGRMSTHAKQMMTEHLTAVWASMIEDFTRVQPGRDRGMAPSAGRGGCSVVLLVCGALFSAIWMLGHLGR